MKTREEIKRGLECFVTGCPQLGEGQCKDCSYFRPIGINHYSCEWGNAITDAIALIQQLETQVSKWISVKERLPDNGQWVLVYCGGYANWFDLNKWCGANWLKTLPVTHWMLLPEPPKEEEHEAD